MAIKTFTAGSILTASDTNTFLANSGLVFVQGGTLSLTTSATNVTAVFSSTYKNYRVLLNITARSTSNRFDMRYLVGTTPTSANYYQGGIGSDYGSNTTAYYQRSNNDNQLYFDTNTGTASYAIDILCPQLAVPTRHFGQTVAPVNPVSYSFGGAQTGSLQHTGFQLFTSTGTMTVDYQVLGYREG